MVERQPQPAVARARRNKTVRPGTGLGDHEGGKQHAARVSRAPLARVDRRSIRG